MEGGRQADVAKGILGAKNFPYIVAAPLLLQVSLVTALAELTGDLKAPAGQGLTRTSAWLAGNPFLPVLSAPPMLHASPTCMVISAFTARFLLCCLRPLQ